MLERTLAAYRGAKAYRDTVHLKLRYEVEGQAFDDATDLSLAFVRPDKLRVELKRKTFLLKIASDGTQLIARPTHPETKDLDGQVLVRPAPSPLGVGTILAATEFARVDRPGQATPGYDQLASFLEETHLTLDDLPLALLLAEKPLAHLTADETKLVRRPDEKLDQWDCFRLAFATEAGDYVYWIEKETHLIRRIEFPTGKLAAELAPAEHQASVQKLALWAEIEAPAFEPPASPEWTLPGAEADRTVRYFVYPPTILPSRLFGRKVGGFAFTDLAGKEVDQSAFDGKISVLVWWNNHPPSRKALVQLNDVYKQFASEPRVMLRAVCAEPGVLNAGHIGAIVNQWNVKVPVLRDVKAAGRDVFQIQDAPTCLVLDAQGFIQLVEVGANPLLGQQLPVVLQRLLRGDNLAAELLKRQAEEQEEYDRQLAIARGEKVEEAAAIDAAIPAATAPRQMKLTPKWQQNISLAGNLLVLPGAAGQSRALVLSEGRKVVELDESGKAGAAVELGLPAGVEASFLRMGAKADGTPIFASAARRGDAVRLHDAQWRVTMIYPPAGQMHDGVQEVLLADLDGDKASECYVGFAGTVGVHQVGPDGKSAWRNRVATPVLALAPFALPMGGNRLLATSDRGLLLPIDPAGREGQAYQVGDKSIHLLAAARFPAPRASAYLGCSILPDGGMLAVALDEQLREVWSYPLPPGYPRTPIEFLQSGKLMDSGAGQWVIAGADGSVHVLSDDGNFVDHYRTGKLLTGLAVCGKLLLVATPEGVEAFEVSR